MGQRIKAVKLKSVASDALSLRAYRVELDPNNRQRTALLNHAGAARFVWNWGLERRIEEYETNKKTPSAFDQINELVKLKKSGELAWLYEASKCVPQNVLQNLDLAFKSFFRNVRQGKKPGFPKFKSRNRGVGGFKLNENITVTEKRIRLPFIGWIKLKQGNYIPNGKYKSAMVTEHAGHWFVSVLQERVCAAPKSSGSAIGVDLGINHLAVTSDGEFFENPKPLKGNLKKLQRQQRQLSRKEKGSRNREQVCVGRVARTHYRIACIRRDALHKVTTYLAKSHSLIAVEDLNVQGMMQNHCLARAISDVGLSEFVRTLEYKCHWYGSHLVFIDRWLPSSKTCSNCGHVKESLALSERVFRCEVCGMVLDRDLNAALNLLDAARKVESVNACGGMSARGSPVEAGIGRQSEDCVGPAFNGEGALASASA